MKRFLALLIVFIMAAPCALAETEITVSGSGVVTVPADLATISLGVETTNPDRIAAQTTVNTAINAVRQALTEKGVPSEDIITDQIYVYSTWETNEEGEKLTYYRASSTLLIRTTDLNNAGTVIDLAFEVGANTLNGVSYSAVHIDQAQESALRAAVADAKIRAQIIADAAGLVLIGPESIVENGNASYEADGVNSRMLSSSGGSETVLQSPGITVSASVTAVYTAEAAK